MNLEEENVATKLMDSSEHYKKTSQNHQMYGDTIVSNPGLHRFWNDYWYLNISHSPQINDNAKNSTVPEPCDYVKWFPLTDTLYVGFCRQFMWSLDDYPESNRDYNSIPVSGSPWKKKSTDYRSKSPSGRIETGFFFLWYKL